MKQVICISWGPKYGPPYVNRLYGGVARNLTPPFSFTCFTDMAEGLRPEVRAEPLPALDVAMPTGTKGIWPKARLWGERLGEPRPGRCCSWTSTSSSSGRSTTSSASASPTTWSSPAIR